MDLAKHIATLNKERPRISIEVPEWGDENAPCTLYFSNISARDVQQVRRKYPNFFNDTETDGMVEMIIRKAETQSGERAFTLEAKPILMDVDAMVITRIFSSIFGAGVSEDAEDSEKN